jgi:hypothetical protein
MAAVVDLSQCSDMPFRYKAGETFKLGLTFSYDVATVLFDLVIYNPDGTAAKTYTDADWVRVGRKKTIIKTPVEFNLAVGEYNLKLKHTYADGSVRFRFDSPFTVY